MESSAIFPFTIFCMRLLSSRSPASSKRLLNAQAPQLHSKMERKKVEEKIRFFLVACHFLKRSFPENPYQKFLLNTIGQNVATCLSG